MKFGLLCILKYMLMLYAIVKARDILLSVGDISVILRLLFIAVSYYWSILYYLQFMLCHLPANSAREGVVYLGCLSATFICLFIHSPVERKTLIT